MQPGTGLAQVRRAEHANELHSSPPASVLLDTDTAANKEKKKKKEGASKDGSASGA